MSDAQTPLQDNDLRAIAVRTAVARGSGVPAAVLDDVTRLMAEVRRLRDGLDEGIRGEDQRLRKAESDWYRSSGGQQLEVGLWLAQARYGALQELRLDLIGSLLLPDEAASETGLRLWAPAVVGGFEA